MEERKPELWEEDWTKQYKTKKTRFRCAALHYLGLILAIPGMFYTVTGLFDAQIGYRVARPGENIPNWGLLLPGLVLLGVGLAMFFFIEE